MAIKKIDNIYGASYQVRVRGLDGRHITKVWRTKKEAEAFEIHLLQQKHLGVLVTSTANQMSVDEYFVRWFGTVQYQASPGWRKLQERMYLNHVQPILGPKKLTKVSPSAIAQVLNRMSAHGRAPTVRLHVYGLLKKMFSDANEIFRILSVSPVLKQLRPKLIGKESKYLSVDEVKKLLLHVSGKPYETAIWLGVYLGLRVGEVQALRWGDVDFERGIIHVRRTYSKHEAVFREYPKGKKHHSVRMPPELFSLLEKEKAKTAGELVAHPPNWAMLDYWNYRRVLKQYCLETGLPVISTHGLRHSTSELYMAHGASRDDLRLLFAHSSSAVTDRYVHDKGSRLERVASGIQLFATSGTKLEQNGSVVPIKEKEGSN